MNFVIAILVGIIVAFIVVTAMKSGLTSVSSKREANNYVVKSSVNIRNTGENFIRKDLEKREIPKSNS